MGWGGDGGRWGARGGVGWGGGGNEGSPTSQNSKFPILLTEINRDSVILLAPLLEIYAPDVTIVNPPYNYPPCVRLFGAKVKARCVYRPGIAGL